MNCPQKSVFSSVMSETNARLYLTLVMERQLALKEARQAALKITATPFQGLLQRGDTLYAKYTEEE